MWVTAKNEPTCEIIELLVIFNNTLMLFVIYTYIYVYTYLYWDICVLCQLFLMHQISFMSVVVGGSAVD